jgi:hypothetical protein
MRRLGIALMFFGALATAGGMFLPALRFSDETLNWWEWTAGFDIALLAACVLTMGLALLALLSSHPMARQFAVITAGVTFGLTFAAVPDAIDNSEGLCTGFWVVGCTGAVALAGAVVSTLIRSD